MTNHYLREVEKLKMRTLALGALVEKQLYEATRAVETRDAWLSAKVIDMDTEVDMQEVEIEEECLKILALYQPVAGDLRYVVSIMKINNDLERIGDLAVNIAERAELLATKPSLEIHTDFPTMTIRVQTMLKKSIDSLVNLDAQMAEDVCKADDEVDHLNRKIYDLIKQGISQDPTAENITTMIHLLSVSRFLERIADHTTNIAQDVIYTIEARIVRHHPKLANVDHPT